MVCVPWRTEGVWTGGLLSQGFGVLSSFCSHGTTILTPQTQLVVARRPGPTGPAGPQSPPDVQEELRPWTAAVAGQGGRGRWSPMQAFPEVQVWLPKQGPSGQGSCGLGGVETHPRVGAQQLWTFTKSLRVREKPRC